MDTTENPKGADEPAAPKNVFSLKGARAVASREDKGTTVHLRDVNGDPLYTLDDRDNEVPAYLVVAGRNSARFRAAEQAVNDRTLKRRTVELTAELVDRNELEKVAACVLTWNLRDGSKPIPCTKENVIEVFRAAPWIRRDVEQAMLDASRFLGG